MKRHLCSALLLSSALLLGACGESGKEQSTNHVVAKELKAEALNEIEANPQSASEKLAKTFPTEVAKQVITTSVTIAEMLKVLDITPVGLPTSSHELPEGFEKIEKVGTAVEPDIEKIVSLTPDLVIGVDSIHTNLEKKIKNTSIPATFLPADSLPQLKVSFEAIAHAMDKEKQADEYLKNLEKEHQDIIASNDATDKKVMLIFGSGESFMLMNTTTYVGSLIEELGAKNIITEATKSKESYVPMNLEDVVAINPSTILIVSHGDAETTLKQFKEEVKKNGAWNELLAFKNEQVYALDYELFGYASLPQSSEGLATLQKMLEK
ncbi:MAG: ABC transporter substrate-binding protein [Kurthia sp.]|nr:ABC transporter substrate-binding protein [Candidatus Kurthia equi]